MITEKDLQLIEDYLNQDLTATEIEDVKERLKSDPQFKAHMEIVRDLPDAMNVDTEGFKHDLKKVMQSVETAPTRVRRLQLRGIIWAVAATAAIVLAVNFLVQDSSPDQLFAQHFNLPAENISVRSNGSVEESLTKGLEAYSAEDHDAATANFERYLADHPDEEAVRFFYSMSQVANEDYPAAEENLRRVEQRGGTYSTSAKWYLGLVYLKLEKLDAASEYFEELASTQGTYQERAKGLLAALK